ncbi:MAG: hypothetical protein HN838_02520, partial [Rhodospirillaceae bacterium]|nr:hypothetical protein [Rhodospirillaceae bacterium]
MPVTAKHDERRAQERVHEPAHQLEISVDGQLITTENWSIGGFRSYGLFHLDNKERFSGHIKVPDSDIEITFTGRILRVEKDGARIASLADIDLDDLLALLDATAA